MQELTKAYQNDQRWLMSVEFQVLAQVPAAVEWFANLDNPRIRRAYQNEVEDFCGFLGLASAGEFRVVTRSHVLAWRAQLEHRGLAGSTIRRRLEALASLFDHLLESEVIKCDCRRQPRARGETTEDRKQRRQDAGIGVITRPKPCLRRRMKPR